MGELRRSTQVFLWTLAALTLVVAVMAFIDTTIPSRRVVVLASIFFALQTIAVIFPLELVPKQKLSLYTSVVFAAVLLFEPAMAMLIAGGGTLLGQVVQRQPSHQILFNTSQTALQAGLAGIVVSWMNWDAGTIRLDRPSAVLVVLVAVACIYGISTIAVGTVVGLEAGQSWPQTARQIPAGSGLDDVAQFALGLLAVLVVDTHLWALPLLLLLALFVYRSSARLAVLREHEQALLLAAEENARLQEEFLMTASHELRTPITAIKAAAQLVSQRLSREGPQTDPQRILVLNDLLLSQVDRLQFLVGDVLDATRIQHGQLELHRQRIDLVGLASQVIDRFDVAPERCEERDIVFDAPQAVDGLWDPVRIGHVVSNLVSNALKYSPAGGEVRVRIIEDGNWVQLDVTDSGIGIPADEQDFLFEPFARGSNTGENIAGSGLGLYIANRIVQRHGGTIAIQSALGTGTTVTARLPRNPMDSLLLDGSSTRGVYVSTSLSSRV